MTAERLWERLVRLRPGRIYEVWLAVRALSPSPFAATRILIRLVAGFFEPHVALLKSDKVCAIRIRTPIGLREVHLRQNGADAFTFYEVFVKGVYDGAAAYAHGVTVLDLGANIGMVSLRALTFWGATHAIAVEPEPRNVDLLHRNLDGLPASIFHAAVGPVAGRGTLGNTATNAGRIEFSSDGATSVEIVTPDALTDRARLGTPRLVKIDIEGAEHDLLRDAWAMWTDADAVAIEVHPPDRTGEVAVRLARFGLTPDERGSGEGTSLFVRPGRSTD